MQRQVEGFVDTVNHELSTRAAASNVLEHSGHSLMPVIKINTIATASRTAEAKRPVEIKRGGEGKQRSR